MTHMGQGLKTIKEELEEFEQIKDDFYKRATRHEFPISKFGIYINFAAAVAGDNKLAMELIRYGLENEPLYKKLTFDHKLLLVDLSIKMQAPFAQTAFNKFTADFLFTGYEELSECLSFEQLMIIAEQYQSNNIKRVELWHKLSTLFKVIISERI
jgi:hypothetical protein